ncbi:hypothetical protein [Cellulomonas biazotea]|uniref:Uncharacterized protein n=1 Tax=Cellulomonas biazotea TaxID=1709 RepID=A0A402DVK9_9CELL|nr:hypothetical protein [Cellulomonas biazotea]GCE78190.1 hypothetical protein CBZ_32460 [Cellulomonas biazotea]
MSPEALEDDEWVRTLRAHAASLAPHVPTDVPAAVRAGRRRAARRTVTAWSTAGVATTTVALLVGPVISTWPPAVRSVPADGAPSTAVAETGRSRGALGDSSATPLDGAAVGDLADACDAVARPGEPGDVGGIPPQEADGLAPVVAEQRADARFLVQANEAWVSTCLEEPTEGVMWSMPTGTPPTPDGVSVLTYSSASVVDELVVVLVGRVGPDVSAVTYVAPSGSRIEATVADGLVVAWWVGARALRYTLEVTRSDGTVVTVPGTGVPGE